MPREEMRTVDDKRGSADSTSSVLRTRVHPSTLTRNESLAGQASHWFRLISIVEATPDFVALFDVEGNIHYCNPAARRILGLGEAGELAGIHISDAHPAWANLLILGEGIETALLDGIWKGEAALLNAEGEEVPVSEVILADFEADGRCEFLSITAREIAEIKQAETAWRESEQFYRRTAEAADIGLWTIDREDKIAFANPRMARLLGCTVDELVGRPIRAFLADEPEDGDTTGSVGSNQVRVFKLRRNDGSELRVNLSSSPLYDQNERFSGTVGVVTPL